MAFSRFTLNTSKLNDSFWALDGPAFPMNATGTASLGSATSSASATPTVLAAGVASFGSLTSSASASVTNQVSAVGALGGVAGVVVAQVAHDASGSAVLGSVSGQVSATVVHSGVAVAGLGAGVATAVSSVLVRPYGDAVLGSLVGSAQATVVPQPPAPTPSYPGGNPWYRRPKVVVDEVVEVVPVELPRLPRRVTSSGSSVVSLSSSVVAEVAWSILEDEADLLLLV